VRKGLSENYLRVFFESLDLFAGIELLRPLN